MFRFTPRQLKEIDKFSKDGNFIPSEQEKEDYINYTVYGKGRWSQENRLMAQKRFFKFSDVLNPYGEMYKFQKYYEDIFLARLRRPNV